MTQLPHQSHYLGKRRIVLFHVVLLTVSLALCGGCNRGSKTVKAGGILKVNGKPVTGTTGTLEFYPVGGGRTANAPVQDDGTFTISYKSPGDGLPPGIYKVAVIADIHIEKPSKKTKEVPEGVDADFVVSQGKLKHLVPQVYNNIQTTPLEYEVVAGNGAQFIELDIAVKK